MADVSDHPKSKVQAVEEAIQLALSFRWQEAVEVNLHLLERFGPDADSQNRLGKALLELGRTQEAAAAYQKTIELDPSNKIAQRQLAKLRDLDHGQAVAPPTTKSLDIKFFTEEPGKTTIARLIGDSDRVGAAVRPGDPVELVVVSGQVSIRSARGADIGTLEPRLAQRLSRLVQGGNRYAGAVTKVEPAGVQVILREVYQAPALSGTVSFPVRKGREADYRPYAKEALLARDEEPVEISDDDGDDEVVVTPRSGRAGAEMEEGFGDFSDLEDADDGDDAEDSDEDDEY